MKAPVCTILKIAVNSCWLYPKDSNTYRGHNPVQFGFWLKLHLRFYSVCSSQFAQANCNFQNQDSCVGLGRMWAAWHFQ